jgi:hypothetical protein
MAEVQQGGLATVELTSNYRSLWVRTVTNCYSSFPHLWWSWVLGLMLNAVVFVSHSNVYKEAFSSPDMQL